MEYREWLADIIVMAANKRGLVPHDTKLIHALIQTVTVRLRNGNEAMTHRRRNGITSGAISWVL